MSVPRSDLPHAYRAGAVREYCCVCQKQATHACPACGHTFCLDHTTFVERCADCDVRLSQREHRAIMVAFGIGVVVTGGLVTCGVVAALCALLGWFFGWMVLGALWVHRQRRRFDHGPPGPRLLQDASISIAPDAPSTDPRLDRSEGYQSRASASLPDVWRTSWGGG